MSRIKTFGYTVRARCRDEFLGERVLWNLTDLPGHRRGNFAGILGRVIECHYGLTPRDRGRLFFVPCCRPVR